MKNLPEDELFDALETTLRTYSELPDDDVWRRVSGVLRIARTPGWIIWSDRTAAAFALMAVLFILYATHQENTDMNELSLSGSLKSNAPHVSGTTSEVLQIPTENPVKTDMPKQNISINKSKDFSGFKTHGVDHRSKRISAPPFDSNGTGDSEVSDVVTRPYLKTASIGDISQDSLYVGQIFKKDTVAKPLQKDIATNEKKKRSGLTMYAMITPMLSYHHVSPLSDDDVVVDKLNSPSILSANRLGITIEAGIQGKITGRLEYLAGMTYYHQSQRVTYEQLTSDNVIVEEDVDKSYIVRPGVLQKSFAYDMQNIGIQTGILYSLKQDGLIHKLGVVINYQKGLGKSSDSEVYDNASSDYLNYQLLYRVEYRLKSGVSFFIQPTYMQSLYTKESIQAPFSLRQSRAGIGAGVVYSF